MRILHTIAIYLYYFISLPFWLLLYNGFKTRAILKLLYSLIVVNSLVEFDEIYEEVFSKYQEIRNR